MSAALKFRVSPWGNINTGEAWYGVQVKVPGHRRWLHCSENRSALVYPTKALARQAIARLEIAGPSAFTIGAP